MPIEPNETERTGEFRMVFLSLVEDAKRPRRIGNFREYASLSVIYEEEALHGCSLTPKAAFLTL
jgi:hypothetical protein